MGAILVSLAWIAACGDTGRSGTSQEEPAVANEQAALVPDLDPDDGPLDGKGVADACNSNADCHSAAACFGEAKGPNSCLCKPGLSACGKRCVDLATAKNHCGACNIKCPKATVCQAGICIPGAQKPPKDLQVDGPFGISAYDPNSCVNSNESYPELSINSPYLFETSRRSFYPATYNWSPDWQSWGSSFLTPPVQFARCFLSDPWSTTSGYSGLEYISGVSGLPDFFCSGVGPKAIGIAATVSSGLDPANTWTYPLDVVNPMAEAWDGPSMNYDIGGGTLWAVASKEMPPPPTTEKPAAYLYIFRRTTFPAGCTGAPGDSTYCPRVNVNPPAWSVCRDVNGNTDTYCVNVNENDAPYTGDSFFGHAAVVVNPCTHHGIVGYRTAEGDVRIKIVNDSGTIVKGFTIQSGQTWTANQTCYGGYNCTDGQVCHCGGGTDCSGSCSQLVSKIQMATKYDSVTDRCYLYAAWDRGDPGTTRFQAKLAIVNLGNSSRSELSPAVTNLWYGPTGGTTQSFASIVSVSYFTRNVGWFYYFDDGTQCNTKYQGRVA